VIVFVTGLATAPEPPTSLHVQLSVTSVLFHPLTFLAGL
jgi:hypothetical protein